MSIEHKESLWSVLWKLFVALLSFSWMATLFVAKNTPKAIITIAHVKRELIKAIQEEIHQAKKQEQEEALEARIAALKRLKHS